MRIRRQPLLIEKVKSHPWRADLVEPGQWRSSFGGNRELLALEIGCGKGNFLAGMAEQDSNTFFLGLEKVPEVIWQACKKMEDLAIPNVRLLQKDARELPELFAPGEVDRIFLNFSDPWPKSRHVKRRLTYRSYLGLYHRVLAPQGEIHFKTDNRSLFEFSLNEFALLGLQLRNISLDLHQNEPPNNVRTEYEEKFSQQGYPIFRAEIFFPPDWNPENLNIEGSRNL